MLKHRTQSTALVPVDDIVDNLPFIVRRDHRIVAAFARKMAAEDWAQMRSWTDESRFTVHTAQEELRRTRTGRRQGERGQIAPLHPLWQATTRSRKPDRPLPGTAFICNECVELLH